MPSNISVVITTYNRGPAIQETLDSVLEQSVFPLEILVVDDGSTDGTSDWLKENYGEQIRVIEQANQGVAAARNRGLQESKGDYIAFLDHDDVWVHTKLEKQLNAMSEGVGVVYCDWEQFAGDGVLSANDGRIVRPKLYFESETVFESLLIDNFIISMSVPLIKTNLLRQVGGFNSSLVPVDDWDVWLKLAEISRFVGLNEVLVRYRQHDSQQSSDDRKMRLADRRLRRNYLSKAFRHPKILFQMYRPNFFIMTKRNYEATRESLFKGDFKKARSQTIKCLSHRPLAAFTRPWVYLIYRIIKQDSNSY